MTSIEDITRSFSPFNPSVNSWKPVVGKAHPQQQQQLKAKLDQRSYAVEVAAPVEVPSLPFVLGTNLINVGEYYTGRTAEAARPTTKQFKLEKRLQDLAHETDLNRQLRHKWVMWNAWPRRSGPNPKHLKDLNGVVDYMAEFREGDVFQTVPDFCKVWNNLYEDSPPYAKIVVFKKGIKPVWEDPDNRQGGRFVIRGANIEETLSMFLVLVCRMMSGRLHGADYNDLCGIILHAKGSDQLWIQVWNKDASDSEGIERLKARLNRLLNRTVAYQVHDQSLKMLKSRTKGLSPDALGVPEPPPPKEKATQREVEDFVKNFLEFSLQ